MRCFFITCLLPLGLAAVICAAGSSAHACNIYLPPSSSFSDDDLMIFGDGEPVALSLGEWREIYGLHDIVTRAGASARRMLSAASIEAARVQEGAARATEAILNSTAAIHRSAASPVPEPGSGALLVAGAVFCWLFRRQNDS